MTGQAYARQSVGVCFLVLSVAIGGAVAGLPDVPKDDQLRWAVSVGDADSIRELIRQGANVNAAWRGRTLLAEAIGTHNVRTVALLLSAGIDVNGKTAQALGVTTTPLCVAVGDLPMVRLLIANGADPNAVDSKGLTPLHNALLCGEYEAACLLVEAGADLNARVKDARTIWEIILQGVAGVKGPQGVEGLELAMLGLKKGAKLPSPVHHAAATGDVQTLGRLLREDPNSVKARYPSRCEPLHWAALMGQDTAVQLLLAKGADVDAEASSGRPLHWAALGGHDGVAKRLLRAGAIAKSRGESSGGPLRWAARRGHAGMCKLLIAAGANPRGAGPIWAAIKAGPETMKVLLEAGADVRRLKLPLHRAVECRSSPEVFRLLLANGVDVDARRTFGKSTALHEAATAGSAETVRVLLEAGANVNAGDKWKSTPLHLAVGTARYCEAAATALIEKGARWDLEDSMGKTALDGAEAYNRRKIVELIQQRSRKRRK